MPLDAAPDAAGIEMPDVDIYRSVGGLATCNFSDKPILLCQEQVSHDFSIDINRAQYSRFYITWVLPDGGVSLDIGEAMRRKDSPDHHAYLALLKEQLPLLDFQMQRVTLALLATLNGQGNAEARSVFMELNHVYDGYEPEWAWHIEVIRPHTYAVKMVERFVKANANADANHLTFVKDMLVSYDGSSICRHMILDERFEVPKGVSLADYLDQFEMNEFWSGWYKPMLDLYRNAGDPLKADDSVKVPLAMPDEHRKHFAHTLGKLVLAVSNRTPESDQECLHLRDTVPPMLRWIDENGIGSESARLNLLAAYRTLVLDDFIHFKSKECFDVYTSLPMLSVVDAKRFVHYKTLAACINNPDEPDEAIMAYLNEVDFVGLFANRLCEHPDWYYLFLIMVYVHPDRMYLLLNAPVFQKRLAALDDVGRVHLYKYLAPEQVDRVPTNLREQAERNCLVMPELKNMQVRSSYRPAYGVISYFPGYTKRDVFSEEVWRDELCCDLKRLPFMKLLALTLHDGQGRQVSMNMWGRYFQHFMKNVNLFELSLDKSSKSYSLTPDERQSLVDLFDVIFLKHERLSRSIQQAFLGIVAILGQGAMQPTRGFTELNDYFKYHYRSRWLIQEIQDGVVLFDFTDYHQDFVCSSQYLVELSVDGPYRYLKLDGRLHLTHPKDSLVVALDRLDRLDRLDLLDIATPPFMPKGYVYQPIEMLYVPDGDYRYQQFALRRLPEFLREKLSNDLGLSGDCIESKDPVPAILAAEKDIGSKRVALTYAYRCSVFSMDTGFNAQIDEILYTWPPHLSLEMASRLGTAECLAGALNNPKNDEDCLGAHLSALHAQGKRFVDLLPYRLVDHPDWFYAFLVLVWVQPERVPLLVNSLWFFSQVAQLDKAGLTHLATYVYPEQLEKIPYFNVNGVDISALPPEHHAEFMAWLKKHANNRDALTLVFRQYVSSGGVADICKMLEADEQDGSESHGVPLWMAVKQCMWGAPWHTLRPYEMALRFLMLCVAGGVLGLVLALAWPSLFAVGAAFISQMPLVVGVMVGVVGMLGASLFADTMKTPMKSYRYPKLNMFLRAIGIGLAFAVVGVICAPVAVVHLAKAFGGPVAAKWAAMMARHWGSAWVVACVLGVGALIHIGFSMIYGAFSVLAVKAGKPWLAKGVLAGHFLLSGLTAFAVFAIHGAQAVASGVHVATQGWFKGIFGTKIGLEVGLPAMHVVVAPTVAAVSLVAEAVDDAVEEIEAYDKDSVEIRHGSWSSLTV